MPILLLLLSQTVMIESVYVWMSTIMIILTIAGVAWRGAVIISKKADIEKVILRPEYEKDLKQINADFDNFAEDIEELHTWKDEHTKLYHSIDTKLEVLLNDVKHIKLNCDKQNCKTK